MPRADRADRAFQAVTDATNAVPAAQPGAVEADGVGGEFSDLFDEQGRARFSNASSVKECKKRTGLGQDGVRAIQAAVQDGRPITLEEARQADIAGIERRNAALALQILPGRCRDAAKILVPLARPGQGGMANGNLQGHGVFR